MNHIGSGEKNHIRQIKGDIKVMVGKGVVLLRIQHFKQSGRGISLVGGANLIDLIQHEYRIIFASSSDFLNNSAGKCPDIGAAVPPNFRFIPDTAQGNSNKFSTQCPGNGASKGCLACARRPEKTEDRALGIFFQFPDGKIFKNSFFRLLKSVMILIQYLSCSFNIQFVL